MNQMATETPQGETWVTPDGRTVGPVMMDVKNITLKFGGVTAISDVSFNIMKGEIRAIIGPNGAGKSSMLNVINGFYHPQEGEIWFNGQKRPSMKPYEVAEQGIARTFQNIALFNGMSTLDNIMSGRLTKMKSNMLMQAIWKGPAEREEVEHRQFGLIEERPKIEPGGVVLVASEKPRTSDGYRCDGKKEREVGPIDLPSAEQDPSCPDHQPTLRNVAPKAIAAA